MKRGLNYTAVAILAFVAGVTVSFFTLPVWVMFALNLAREGSRTDWLGFFGSVVGAVVAVGAATAAWFAVQRQIRIQRDIAVQQTAIQQFQILQGILQVLQEEDRLNDLIRLESQYTAIPETTLANTPLMRPHIVSTRELIDERILAIDALDDEFLRAGKNSWVFPDARRARREARTALLGLKRALLGAKQIVLSIEHRTPAGGLVSVQDQTTAKAISMAPARGVATMACQEFEKLLLDEIKRTVDAISKIRKQAGL